MIGKIVFNNATQKIIGDLDGRCFAIAHALLDGIRNGYGAVKPVL
jgi:hypothetical protein